MRSLLLLFLFALVACDFEKKVLKFASCAFESKKLRENLPKVIEALKAGDFSKILSIGLSSFVEIKNEILDCVNDEPVLSASDCKNSIMYMACIKGCPFLGRKKCLNDCWNHFCK